MVQAVHVAVPTGIDPSRAVPSDAVVYQRSGAAPGTPPAPAAPAEIFPGIPDPSAPKTPPAAQDPQYAEFLQWKAAQAAEPRAPAAPAEPAKPVEKPAVKVDAVGATESVDAARTAAHSDPYLGATFSLFEVSAPDVDLTRAIGNAIDRSDASLIDRAYIREKGGAHAEKLIKAAEGLVDHIDRQVASVTTAIYGEAGGEQQFNLAVAAFNKHAPAYLRESVANGLNSYNRDKVLDATKGMLQFVKDGGYLVTNPQGHVRAGGGSPDSALAMTKAQYQEARRQLNMNDRNYAEKERELTARRQLGRNMGI